MMEGMTNDTFIEMLENTEDVERADKVMMAINLLSPGKIVEDLTCRAMMSDIGVQPVSELDQFVYIILKLARPDLFDEL